VINQTPAYAADLRWVFDLRFEAWPKPPPSITESPDVDAIADRVRGLVFGAALGDSIGLATEFMTREKSMRNIQRTTSFDQEWMCTQILTA
jgi:hypothetical protein